MSNELDRRLLLGTAGLAGIAALSAAGKAGGPLNPPAGAVSSTGKTLDQVEPRQIVEDVPVVGGVRTLNPGAWKMTAPYNNSSVPIRLTFDVDLDLGGFSHGFATVFSLQVDPFGSARIRIHNGRVFGPIFSTGTVPHEIVLEDLDIQGGTVRIGDKSVVRNCSGMGATIQVGHDSIAESCTLEPFDASSVNAGLSLGDRAVVRGVRVRSRAGAGITGLSVGNSSQLTGCVCTNTGGVAFSLLANCSAIGCIAESSGNGFVTGVGCILSRCTSVSIGTTGTRFILGNQSTAEGCTGRGSSAFQCGEDVICRDCLAYGLGAATGADGFLCIGAGTSFEGCTARSWPGRGFVLANSSRIERCLSVSNGGGGYAITSDTLARGNHADSNSVFGMLVTGSDNRIEGNSLTDGSLGLQVDLTGNLVIGNSVAGATTAYAIAAGNAAGPIVLNAGVATNTVSTANFAF